MKLIEFLKNHLHHYLSTVLLFGIVAIGVSNYCQFTLSPIIILLFSCLWIAGVRAFDYNKKMPIPYLIVAFVIIITVVIGLCRKIDVGKLIQSYYQWLMNQIDQVPNSEIGEGIALAYTLLSIWLIHIISTPIYFITKWRKSRYVVAVGGIIALVIVFLLNLDLPKMVVALFFSYLFLCFIEVSFRCQHHNAMNKSTEITTFLTPIVLAFSFVLCTLPTNSEPMKFLLLKHVWNQVVEFGENLTYQIDVLLHPPTNSEFALSFSGYSEDATLGEGVESNDAIAMYVKDSSNNRTCAYLIGNVKNEFVGDGWICSVNDGDMFSKYTENELEMYQLTNAILHSSKKQYINSIIDKRTLDITYQDISTKTVFYQARTGYFELLNNVSKVSQAEGKMIFKKQPGREATYRTKALELRLGTTATTEFLQEVTSKNAQYEALPTEEVKRYINYQLKLPNLPDIESLSDAFARQDEMVADNYMNLPENVSEKVKSLAYEITKDASSDYEKLKMIEAYLNSLTYTMRPTKVPKGENFLDYFLFQSKEGYCTYFATAMAILSRCIGIPSRYIQGYCVPIDRLGYSYAVTGDQAHAWIEAYLKGVGWISFEPTPGYANYLYKAKLIYDREKLDTSVDYSEFYERLKDKYQVGELQEKESEISLEKVELTRGKTYAYLIVILIGIIVAAILLSTGYLFFRVHHSSKAFRQANRHEQLFVLLKRILITIQHFKFCKEENPTLYQQFMSVDQEEEFAELPRKKIMEYYMRLCYGDGNFSEKEETLMFDFYQTFMNYSKTHLLKLQFYLLQLKLIRVKVEAHIDNCETQF